MEEDIQTLRVNLSLGSEDTEAKMKTFMTYKIGKLAIREKMRNETQNLTNYNGAYACMLVEFEFRVLNFEFPPPKLIFLVPRISFQEKPCINHIFLFSFLWEF